MVFKRGNLYFLELTKGGEKKSNHALRTHRVEKACDHIWLWHKRLGHILFGYIQKLKPDLFLGLYNSVFHCDIYEFVKNHRVPYLSSLNKFFEPFAVIHSDISGPAKVESLSQARYFITFIDECTRMTWISLLQKKSDAYIAFKDFYNMVHTQYQRQIRVWQSDNAMEFMQSILNEYLRQQGVRHQTSCTYTPQQNGLAEIKNRQIMEIVRASLFGMNMPYIYWGGSG